MALRQQQDLRLQQRLSPVQIQMIKLLELNTMDMEQRMRKEFEENPVLDEEMTKNEEDEKKKEYIDDPTPAYRYITGGHSQEERPVYDTLSVKKSFTENLLDQLGYCDLSDHMCKVASFVINSLDERGYLGRDVDSLIDDMAFKQGLESDEDEVNAAIAIIQKMDPPGVGARDLRECLLLQMRDAPHNKVNDDTRHILSNCFPDFAARHYDKIMHRTGMSREDIQAVVNRLRKLNPAPGRQSDDGYSDQTEQIVPDFTLETENGELKLDMPRFKVPELKVKREYAELIKEAQTSNDRAVKEGASFVRQKLDAAKWFVEALKQRHNTLMTTMQAIVDFQRDYFLSGEISDLKPMVLKDIAEKTGFDISTVSRVANSKYVQTWFGVFSLKSFFSEGLVNTEGEEVSTREIKKALSDAISEEDHSNPLTDDQLVDVMIKKGYKIARRTVAKYRDQLGIPTARLRREV